MTIEQKIREAFEPEIQNHIRKVELMISNYAKWHHLQPNQLTVGFGKLACNLTVRIEPEPNK